MSLVRQHTYASRLKQAMDDMGCTVAKLALVCECSEQTIKDARSGRLAMLNSEYHFKAAFYLRIDAIELAYGDALPIAESLASRMFSKLPSRPEYLSLTDKRKDAIHELLQGAVEDLARELKQEEGK